MAAFGIAQLSALFLVMTEAARAHEGPHLHPHLVEGVAAQPLHPAVVLALLVAAWGGSLLCADAFLRLRRRRRG